MNFQNALALKQELIAVTLRRLITASSVGIDGVTRSRNSRSKPMLPRPWLRRVMIGVGRSSQGKGHTIAVRVQDKQMLTSPILAAITKAAKGEVDVRYVGRVAAFDGGGTKPRLQHRLRPIEMGASLGHKGITAGTLGAVVYRGKAGRKPYVLTNNHVGADTNSGLLGDEILQPGPADGGTLPNDVVARLSRYVPISFTEPNLVDAAILALEPGIVFAPNAIPGLGNLGAVRDAEIGMEVWKVGRTTGRTHGRVTAVGLDDVTVDMGTGIASFDNQIEIESIEDGPFSLGGDSGSLIVDAEGRPIALLFANSDLGGAGGYGLTYANPIDAVLEALGVRF